MTETEKKIHFILTVFVALLAIFGAIMLLSSIVVAFTSSN